MSRRPATGFSLIELLVSIGILSILMGFLFPVIRQSRASALAVRCRGSLHDIGNAIQAYRAGSRGHLPPASVQGRNLPLTPWPIFIFGKDVWHNVVCPLDTTNYSYELNTFACIADLRNTLNGRSSATIVLAGENWSEPADYFYYTSPVSTAQSQVEEYSKYKHGLTLKSNLLWLDYHVSNELPERLPGKYNDWEF